MGLVDGELRELGIIMEAIKLEALREMARKQ